jgi:hypothetical protein
VEHCFDSKKKPSAQQQLWTLGCWGGPTTSERNIDERPRSHYREIPTEIHQEFPDKAVSGGAADVSSNVSR